MALRLPRSAASETDDVADTQPPAHDQEQEHPGPLASVFAGLRSAFSHPAAGKLDPPVEDIGSVGPEKAATLRNAEYDTAREVYQADRAALADALDDRTYAGYLQQMAERTLQHSEASVLASRTENRDPQPALPPLTEIKQIGDARARVLRNAGYTSVADVASLDTATLITIEGISRTRAETILDSAHDLLEEHPTTGPADATGDG